MSESVWFSGPVKDAVSLVNQKDCVFLVYIYDDSDKTKTLDNTLNDEEIANHIKQHAVALKMEKDSENASLFSQLYPIQTVPILYFIRQGVIREFGTEAITKQELLEKITAAKNQTTVGQQNASLNTNTSSEASGSRTTVDTPFENQNNASTNNNANVEAAAAKKAELQKRLEEARKQRAEQERQEERAREIKRRNEAKAIQEAQQMQKDKENQLYLEKIKKERKEAEEHKRRVREQIARDRAERLAERKAEKERQEVAGSSSQQIDNTSKKRHNHEYSNLNIRLLDGTNMRHQFEASDTLATVKHWIEQNRTDEKRDYKLSSLFPTRLFTEADDNTSLRDLDLCPSATIILKRNKNIALSLNQNNSSQLGFFQAGLGHVYAFFVGLLTFFAGLFGTLFPRNEYNPIQPSAASEQQGQEQQQQQHQQQQSSTHSLKGGHRLGGIPNSSEDSTSTSVADRGQRRTPFTARFSTLYEGNDNAENEKRPTYNGNSVNHE
ncbi:hypothetical protein RMATCC62417_03224 [Rhizopus microsporus]|nr:hypothetical protein RMATCC62417_03224 [Rhizopus microsporus]